MIERIREHKRAMTAKIRVVGFDLDDTLWEVEPVILRAEQALAGWFREAVPSFRYDRVHLRRIRDQVLETEPHLSGRLTELRRRILIGALEETSPDLKATTIADDAMKVFLEHRHRIEPYPGVAETLAELSRQYTLAALTNGNANIHRTDIGHHFDFSFSAEEIGAPKPHAALFEAALSHAGVEASEMVYVGDDPKLDIDAANRAGLKTIWIRRDLRQGEGETRPNETISQVTELPGALARLNRAD